VCVVQREVLTRMCASCTLHTATCHSKLNVFHPALREPQKSADQAATENSENSKKSAASIVEKHYIYSKNSSYKDPHTRPSALHHRLTPLGMETGVSTRHSMRTKRNGCDVGA